MSHHNLVACFEDFDEAYQSIGNKNRICSMELDQENQFIILDMTNLPPSLLNMDDGQAQV